MTRTVKERPILFNDEMVCAILDGRKTQTRRIMAIQPEHSKLGLRRVIDSKNGRDNGKYFWSQSDACGQKARSKVFGCPYGVVGDRIWVRETFCSVPDHDEPAGCSGFLYAADGGGPYGKWTPSIHMPRAASRILLEVTDVRVERLNDISEEDAAAEGVAQLRGGFWKHYQPGWTQHQLSARGSFVTLWKSIYGEESWQANPWVWVIEFMRIEGEE